MNPMLSGFELLKNSTLIIKNSRVSRLFANMFIKVLCLEKLGIYFEESDFSRIKYFYLVI